MNVSADGKSERVDGELVSGALYFPVLGVGPALGRVFTADDDKTPGASPYAVIGYRYWWRRFAERSDCDRQENRREWLSAHHRGGQPGWL